MTMYPVCRLAKINDLLLAEIEGESLEESLEGSSDYETAIELSDSEAVVQESTVFVVQTSSKKVIGEPCQHLDSSVEAGDADPGPSNKGKKRKKNKAKDGGAYKRHHKN